VVDTFVHYYAREIDRIARICGPHAGPATRQSGAEFALLARVLDRLRGGDRTRHQGAPERLALAAGMGRWS
jgi:hypothetical protein